MRPFLPRRRSLRVTFGHPLLAAVLVTLVGCASGSGGSSGGMEGAADGPVGASGWERVPDPFPVTGPEGRRYPDPFVGGFNQPRPQLVDIDADGDEDLFIQEASNQVAFYEHTGDAEFPFRWRTDRFGDLEIGEWYRFVDMDQDGDWDLLAEQPFSYIRYYRNEGTPSEPDFVLAADSLRDVDGDALFSDRQNIPNATDLDADGSVDLLVGRLEGTITRYEQEGANAAGVPVFRLVTTRFEDIEIVAELAGGSLHGANTMALGDIDGDGDDDLFWGDFFEQGLLLIRNLGSPQSPSFRTNPVPFPQPDPLLTSGYNAPTVGDIDVDGDPDLLVGVLGGAFNPNTTTRNNLHLVEQTAPGTFAKRTPRFVGTIDVGSESVPVLQDLDGDGDLDLLVSNKITQFDNQNGQVHIFRNQGTPTAPELVHDGVLASITDGYHFVPAFGDLDGDGDADAVVGTWGDELRYYEGSGDAGAEGLVLRDSAVVTLSRGRNAAPALADLDADGDLDLVVGESGGELNYWRNEGDAGAPDFVLVSDTWLEADVGRRSFPVPVDWDGDGDLDLLVGSEGDGLQLFRNRGSASTPDFVTEPETVDIPDFGYATPAFGDLDGDGRAEMVLGGTGGGLWYFRAAP